MHSEKKYAAVRKVQSIEVAGRILEFLASTPVPMSLTEIAKGTDISPSHLHAYITSLVRDALIEKDSEAGLYHIGPFALSLGLTRLRILDPISIAHRAMGKITADLGCTVAMSVWGAAGPTVIQMKEGRDPLYMLTRPGTIYSVGGTATGRVFAAYLATEVVKPTIDREIKSDGTIIVGTPIAFEEISPLLQTIREQGFADIDPPPVPGVRAIAVPIFDQSDNLSLVLTMISKDVEALRAAFIQHCNELTFQLGSHRGIIESRD